MLDMAKKELAFLLQQGVGVIPKLNVPVGIENDGFLSLNSCWVVKEAK